MPGWLERRRLPIGNRRPGNSGKPKGSPGPGGGNGGGGGGGGRGRGRGGGSVGAGVTAAVTTFQAPASTGTFNITTTDLGGLTPKGAIFIWSGVAVTLDSIAANAVWSMGATDGTTQFCHGWTSIDNSPNTTSKVYGDTSHVLVQRNVGSDTIARSAAFSSWITNGVTLNMDVTGGSTPYGIAIFFAGDDISVDASVQTLAAASSSVTVTTGFEPNAIFLISDIYNKLSNQSGTYNDNAKSNFGFATYNGTTTRQCGWSFREGNNLANGSAEIDVADTTILNDPADAGTLTVQNVTSTGFDVASVGDFSGASGGFLSINVPSQNVWCGVKDAPTATGSYAVTDPGFLPEIALVAMSMASATGGATDATAGSNGVYAATADAEAGVSFMVQDGAGTTNTASLVNAASLDLNTDAQAAAFDATLTGMGSSGATWSFTAANGTARKWPMMFIG